MPVRLPPLTERPSRILLEAIIDYAGLFPPASLDMARAVRNFAHYRAGGAGWMLGRFVCPASRLAEFSAAADPLLPRDAGAIPWLLSVTGSGDLHADLEAITAFNERHRVCFDECGARVDSYEAKVGSVAEIMALHDALPRSFHAWLEVPIVTDPSELLEAIAKVGRFAKMRTGGTVAEAFPSKQHIVDFLRALLTYDVRAKATAGLHHPLCGTYRLTYEPEAATCRMFGFLNVLLAAAVIANGGTDTLAVQAIEEARVSSLEFSETHLVWHAGDGPIAIARHTLQQVREHMIVSIGSCSFTEPVDESRALGWI
jgi:hypothetical protein